MTGEEAYNYLLGLLELEDDIRWPLVKESMNKFKELVDQQSILEEYNVTPEILREVLLTGQMFRNQPSLNECIEAWEKREFRVNEYKRELLIESKKYDLTINIYKTNLTYEISDYYESNPACVLPELHQLLTQTLKVMEKIKNDKN